MTALEMESSSTVQVPRRCNIVHYTSHCMIECITLRCSTWYDRVDDLHLSIALYNGVHYMHLWPVASLLSPSLTPVISHHPLHSTALQHHHPCRHPQPLSVGLYPVITFVASQGSLH